MKSRFPNPQVCIVSTTCLPLSLGCLLFTGPDYSPGVLYWEVLPLKAFSACAELESQQSRTGPEQRCAEGAAGM